MTEGPARIRVLGEPNQLHGTIRIIGRIEQEAVLARDDNLTTGAIKLRDEKRQTSWQRTTQRKAQLSAPSLLSSIRSAFPWLRHVFADGGYAGEKLEQSLVPLGNWTIDIAKRSDIAKGFVLLPRRRVVERTLA